jgi:tetratricopeptide (TPR) repeat protein
LRELAPAARQQAIEQGDESEISVGSAWLDALLALDRGDAAAAAALLANAPQQFSKTSPWPGRLETLRAEVDLGAGRFSESLLHARAGRTAAAAAHDQAEEARALRIAGSAQMGLGQWPEARIDFLAALKIEQALGAGARMIGDLNHLATIAEHLGDTSAAQLYAQRASAIAGAR